MSFYESPRFPDNIAFSAVGGPKFSTNVIVLVSGYEARNANWTNTRYEYDLAIPPRSQTEVETINAFFRTVQGRAYGFRFKDYADHTATSQPATSVGNSPNLDFQMYKRYTSGAQTNDRKISKPVDGTVFVYVSNVLQTTGFTVDYETGVISFSSAPAGAVTWSGDFDVPVRFDIDALRWRVIDRVSDGLIYQIDSLPLVEVRV
jgi:uncharacterized protein (TIGR02217 family)